MGCQQDLRHQRQLPHCHLHWRQPEWRSLHPKDRLHGQRILNTSTHTLRQCAIHLWNQARHQHRLPCRQYHQTNQTHHQYQDLHQQHDTGERLPTDLWARDCNATVKAEDVDGVFCSWLFSSICDELANRNCWLGACAVSSYWCWRRNHRGVVNWCEWWW